MGLLLEMSTNGCKRNLEPGNIYDGQPEQILGLTKVFSEYHLLVRWTHGKAYVPYAFMKEHFPLMVLEYIASTSQIKHVGFKQPRDQSK